MSTIDNGPNGGDADTSRRGKTGRPPSRLTGADSTARRTAASSPAGVSPGSILVAVIALLVVVALLTTSSDLITIATVLVLLLLGGMLMWVLHRMWYAVASPY